MKVLCWSVFFVALSLQQRISLGVKPDAKYWIDKYSLVRNMEGGVYVETYRSKETCDQLPERYGANATRTFSTHIYYLLENKDFSLFHRLKTDEMWHHYHGASLNLYVIDQMTGNLTVHHLGPAGKKFAAVVKAGNWYAASLRSPSFRRYCLLGITVSPGFEFVDYEEAKRDELIREYPQHKETITKLTRD